MLRTGKSRFFTPLLLLLLLSAFTSAFAQSAKVTATLSETDLYTGERVSLTVDITGKNFNNVSTPELPDLKGLEYLSTSPSTSSNYSFINGVISRSYSYTYYLQADKEGHYTIPAVKVTIDGKTFSTDPISVNIRNRNKAAATQSGSQKPDIYLRMEVSDKRPVVGQQIIASVVIYFRSNLQVISYQPMAGWKAEGFWKEELDNGQQPKAVSTIIDGVRYRKAVLMKYALFPSKVSKLQLSPYEVNCTVRYSSDYGDPFSSFFNGFGSDQRSVDLKTDPISVDVNQLPPSPSSAEALNAVGQFDITRSTDDTNVRVGQSVEIKTVIKGTGNIALISKPDYKFPSAFEVYQPQEQSNIDHKSGRIKGTKTFTDVIIPRKTGTYTIPSTRLAYYNDSENKYQYVDLSPITLNVKANPNAGALTTSQPGGLDVQPLNGLVTWQVQGYRSIFSLWWMWAGLILPLVLLIVGYQRKQYLDKLRNDSHFARSTQAAAKADEYLEQARGAARAGDLKEAYARIHQSISGFIGDRLNLPPAGLEDDVYVKALRNKGVDMDVVKRIERLLTKCSTIRYAPMTSQEDFAQDADTAHELIKSLRKWL